MAYHRVTLERTENIINEIKNIVHLIEINYADPYSPEGLYDIFKDGIMPVPYLWEGRDEFKNAVNWNTSLVNGSINVVDQRGNPIVPSDRIKSILKEKSSLKIKKNL